MSAECLVCGHDLPFEGDCQWCALQARIAELGASLTGAIQDVDRLEAEVAALKTDKRDALEALAVARDVAHETGAALRLDL